MKTIKPMELKQRRNFFRKVAMMGAAALLGAAGGHRVQASPVAPGKPLPGQSRYRMTEHIRRYYKCAAR